MKHNYFREEVHDQPCLDISSLIDVCFLLLIYFLVTSTITPRESDLDMKLPGGQRVAEIARIEPLRIRLDSMGSVSVEEEPCDMDPTLRDLPILGQRLSLYSDTCRASGAIPVVRMDVEDDVSHQRFIDVLNTLARNQIHAVTFVERSLLP